MAITAPKVFRESRQVISRPVSAPRVYEGNATAAAFERGANEIAGKAFSRAAKDAQTKGVEFAQAIDPDQIITIDPETGEPVAVGKEAMAGMGNIGSDAYRRVIQSRYQQSIEEEIKNQGRIFAAKYQNPDVFGRNMANYLENMSANATGYWKGVIQDIGKSYLASATSQLRASQLRRFASGANRSSKDSVEEGAKVIQAIISQAGAPGVAAVLDLDARSENDVIVSSYGPPSIGSLDASPATVLRFNDKGTAELVESAKLVSVDAFNAGIFNTEEFIAQDSKIKRAIFNGSMANIIGRLDQDLDVSPEAKTNILDSIQFALGTSSPVSREDINLFPVEALGYAKEISEIVNASATLGLSPQIEKDLSKLFTDAKSKNSSRAALRKSIDEQAAQEAAASLNEFFEIFSNADNNERTRRINTFLDVLSDYRIAANNPLHPIHDAVKDIYKNFAENVANVGFGEFTSVFNQTYVIKEDLEPFTALLETASTNPDFLKSARDLVNEFAEERNLTPRQSQELYDSLKSLHKVSSYSEDAFDQIKTDISSYREVLLDEADPALRAEVNEDFENALRVRYADVVAFGPEAFNLAKNRALGVPNLNDFISAEDQAKAFSELAVSISKQMITELVSARGNSNLSPDFIEGVTSVFSGDRTLEDVLVKLEGRPEAEILKDIVTLIEQNVEPNSVEARFDGLATDFRNKVRFAEDINEKNQKITAANNGTLDMTSESNQNFVESIFYTDPNGNTINWSGAYFSGSVVKNAAPFTLVDGLKRISDDPESYSVEQFQYLLGNFKTFSYSQNERQRKSGESSINVGLRAALGERTFATLSAYAELVGSTADEDRVQKYWESFKQRDNDEPVERWRKQNEVEEGESIIASWGGSNKARGERYITMSGASRNVMNEIAEIAIKSIRGTSYGKEELYELIDKNMSALYDSVDLISVHNLPTGQTYNLPYGVSFDALTQDNSALFLFSAVEDLFNKTSAPDKFFNTSTGKSYIIVGDKEEIVRSSLGKNKIAREKRFNMNDTTTTSLYVDYVGEGDDLLPVVRAVINDPNTGNATPVYVDSEKEDEKVLWGFALTPELSAQYTARQITFEQRPFLSPEYLIDEANALDKLSNSKPTEPIVNRNDKLNGLTLNKLAEMSADQREALFPNLNREIRKLIDRVNRYKGRQEITGEPQVETESQTLRTRRRRGPAYD